MAYRLPGTASEPESNIEQLGLFHSASYVDIGSYLLDLNGPEALLRMHNDGIFTFLQMHAEVDM